MSFNPISKGLILTGAILIVAGLFWQFGAKLLPLGKLPGDIAIERPGFRFYFPVTTSLILSGLLSLLAFLWQKKKL